MKKEKEFSDLLKELFWSRNLNEIGNLKFKIKRKKKTQPNSSQSSSQVCVFAKSLQNLIIMHFTKF